MRNNRFAFAISLFARQSSSFQVTSPRNGALYSNVLRTDHCHRFSTSAELDFGGLKFRLRQFIFVPFLSFVFKLSVSQQAITSNCLGKNPFPSSSPQPWWEWWGKSWCWCCLPGNRGRQVYLMAAFNAWEWGWNLFTLLLIQPIFLLSLSLSLSLSLLLPLMGKENFEWVCSSSTQFYGQTSPAWDWAQTRGRRRRRIICWGKLWVLAC